MKASILIPAFNAAHHLEATLLSCVDQGADVVDEIIVVDDHSNDDSEAVFSRVSEAHPEFTWKWVTNPKKGACSARNHAFSISTSDWIQWLDADDLLGPMKIVTALKLLEHIQDRLVSCPWHPFSGGLNSGRLPDIVDWSTIPNFSNPAEWIARDTYMVPHCYLGHRHLFEQAGHWDESLTINQDGEYFAKVVAKSEGVRFTRETEVFYRRSPESSVSRFSPKKADSLYRSTESMVRTALDLEDSKRMEQMAANRWQHFIYTVYPSRSDLVARAKNHLRHLPRPNISNPNAVSPLSRFVSTTMGWKTLTQARLLRARLQSR
mgnify:CR=1 FL=1